MTTNLNLSALELPAVPLVATKVMDMVSDPNTSLNELHKVIISDQALTSRLLKVANSSFYGARHQVDTISEAIAIMGLNTLKNITLAVSTREVYKKFGIIEQKLWEHSIGVSIAAGMLADYGSTVKKEEAVIAGLLHDIGKVIMNNHDQNNFSLLLERIHEEKVAFSSIEKDFFGFGHEEAGYMLMNKWGFPHMLCEVVRNHHNCILDEAIQAASSSRILCATIALADAICVKLGVGYKDPMPELYLGEGALKKVLGIPDDDFSEISEAFKMTYIREKMFFTA
jgi:putative nucleotidyltransferase with HDIG domain